VIKELLPEEKNAKTDLLINRVPGRRQGRENQLAVYVRGAFQPKPNWIHIFILLHITSQLLK
jgi:hypothetical protein